MNKKDSVLSLLWLIILLGTGHLLFNVFFKTAKPIPAWFANTAIEVCQQHEGLKEFSYSNRKFGPVVCKNGIQIIVPQSFQKPETVDFDGAVLYDNKVYTETKGE